VPEVVDGLKTEFNLAPYVSHRSFKELDGRFDAAYFRKSGVKDGKIFENTPSLVHCVFQNYDPHGVWYGYISEWLARTMSSQAKTIRSRFRARMAERAGCLNASEFDWLPSCTALPEATAFERSSWDVPETAFVVLRYGAWSSFDVPSVRQAVSRALEARPDMYFIGVNTPPFTDHPRARFLPAVYTEQEKANLLASADLFLHARSNGESFGLAILEALQSGVPILSWSGGEDQNHVALLRDLDCLFSDAAELHHSLLHWSASMFDAGRDARLAAGNAYSPEVVGAQLEGVLKRIAN